MKPGLSFVVALLGPLLGAVALLSASHFAGNVEQSAAQGLKLSLDADVSNGGPCASIDSDITVAPGEAFQVGVCLSGIPEAIGAFQFKIIYDDTIINAHEIALEGEALDDNPDVNAGATTWGDGLGENWSCNILDMGQQPIGDNDPETGPGHGLAEMDCWSTNGPYTLGDNEDAGVLAVFSFNGDRNHLGTTTLEWANGVIASGHADELGECNPAAGTGMECNGATVHVAGPTIAPDQSLTPTPAGEIARPTVPPGYVPPSLLLTPGIWGNDTPEVTVAAGTLEALKTLEATKAPGSTKTPEATKTPAAQPGEETQGGGGTDWLWPTVIGIVVAVVVVGVLSLAFYLWRRGRAR
jgi:hypothetical protein